MTQLNAANSSAIVRGWNELTRFLNPYRQPSYAQAMGMVVKRMKSEPKYNGFKTEVCKLAILSVIQAGVTTRDEIVRAVPRLCGATYRQAGFLLDRTTGDVPDDALWRKGDDGHYFALN